VNFSHTVNKVVDSPRHVNFIEMIQNELQHFLTINFQIDIFHQISQNQPDYSFVFLCDIDFERYERIHKGFVDNL
jgi:hypothetical protein